MFKLAALTINQRIALLMITTQVLRRGREKREERERDEKSMEVSVGEGAVGAMRGNREIEYRGRREREKEKERSWKKVGGAYEGDAENSEKKGGRGGVCSL